MSQPFDLTPYARYQFGDDVVDQLPRLTYLIGSQTNQRNVPGRAVRICNAREGKTYADRYRTPGGRVLFQFWTAKTSSMVSVGRKQLNMTGTHAWGWVVRPGEPGYELLDAFKVACDHRVGQEVSPKLLLEALGLT
jgi:hypothetical protein